MTELSERSARVVAAAKLQRRSERAATGRFLAEGPNLVEAAARLGVVVEVFATEIAAQRHHSILADLPVSVVTDRAMKSLSDTVTPAGLIAVCRRPEPNLDEILSGQTDLIVVGADISDPGNAGTLIRLGHAMGAAAVVFSGTPVDPYNGKCLRSSAGSIFTVPVLVEPDTIELMGRLRAAGVQVLATALDGEVSLDDADGLLGTPTAWVFGSEAHGLPEEVAGAADHCVTIPMSTGIDSLNVAVAAAICLYQSARVRRRR